MKSLRYLVLWLSIYSLVLLAAAQIKHIHFSPPQGAIVLADSLFFDLSNAVNDTPQNRSLPDNWQWHQRPTSYAKYRLEFSAKPDKDEVWGIMIPTLRSNLRVTLNGDEIGNGGSMQSPIANNLRRPLLFAISSSALKPNQNILEIELKSSTPGKGFLDQLYLAPYAVLEPAYKRHFFYRIRLVESITVGLVFMALLMAVLGALRPGNKEYAWFALATLLWAAHNSTIHISHVIWSNKLWDWFFYCTIGWFSLAAHITLMRFEKMYAPRYERGLLIFAITLPAIMLTLSPTAMHWLADHVWHPISLGLGGFTLFLVSRYAWKTRNIEYQLLAASGVVIIPYAVHDLLLIYAILPWEHGYYIQFGAVILLMMFALVLLHRFVQTSIQAERLNSNLEQTVAAKTEQIRNAMQRNRELEKKQWLTEERARITRDMHDGVAGQIVSTITSLEHGHIDKVQIHQQLEYCINDIRLMIDSLDNEDNDLVSLLGMFRYRIELTLEQANIKLNWQPLLVEQAIRLTPTTALNLLRMLQEAVHNAIRHAKCSTIFISTQLIDGKDSMIRLEIRDDGIGVPQSLIEATEPFTNSGQTGRGLNNLRYRAAKIGATLTITANKSGTKIVLKLPC